MLEPWMLHDTEFATVVTVEKPGRFIALCDGQHFTREENARHAEFIADAPTMAAERDRLIKVLEGIDYAIDQEYDVDDGVANFSADLVSAWQSVRAVLAEARKP